MPVTKALYQNTDKSEQLDAIMERSDNGANIADTDDIDEYVIEPALRGSRTHQEQEIGTAMNRESEQAQLNESSNLELCSEVDPGSPHVNEPDSSLDVQGSHNIDSLPKTTSTEIEHQPLDPTLFKELEDCFQHEPETYEDQVTSGNWDHRLLFYLVNETLLEVYERSYTYFPRAFSLQRLHSSNAEGVTSSP
ncbi:hypothetical protein C1H46_011140 [Malus baccata]|uniref:DUF4378 domain-containing protein n=1 Tax=Malus baccata TaxID=106549 RepID=A0A540MWV0_MALBA|nr:hypothetical protein C1H46_011140 [Malus baccata]